MLIHTQENNLEIPDKLKFKAELRPMSFLDTKKKNKDISQEMASVLVRTDTEEPLSIVGSRYEPTQYYDLAQKQADGLEKSGLLNKHNFICKDFLFENGRKWKRSVLIKDLTIEPQVGDIVNYQNIAKSSHDLSLPNITDSTPNRLNCSNGMVTAIWDMVFAFRHTIGFNVDVLSNIFEESAKKFIEMEPYFKSMGQKKVSVSDVELSLKQTICKKRKSKKQNIQHKEKLLGWLLEQYHKETNMLGNTMWAFYNALTNWATHPELYPYKEDSKFHNLQEKNTNKVLVFLQSPQFLKLMDR